MRTAVIVAVYPPEPEPAAIMAAEVTERWVASGHEVAVICPRPSRPKGIRYHGFKRWERRSEGGRRVSRVWAWPIGRRRKAINRILENVTFGISSAIELAMGPRPDVAIVESWPILAYLPVVAVAGARRIPFVNYIQDVYPEAAVSGGQLKDGSAPVRLLRAMDRFICSRAARNIVVGPRMQEALASTRRLAPDRFFVIENWLDTSKVGPVSGDAWRGEVGVAKDEFVALFAGTMGYASGVDVLVEVAERLRDRPEIRLVCVGGGVLRDPMAREIEARRLTNLTLLPFQPRERIAEVQSAADVALLTTAPGVGSSSVPSKLITYLATGRPILCAAAPDSDVARLVREERVGEVVAPGKPAELAAALLRLRAMSLQDRLDMGKRAREVAERRFSIEAAVARFAELFRQLGLPGRPGE